MLTLRIIASMFFILWIIMYPGVLREILAFHNHDGAVGTVVSMLTWLFLCLFVYTIVEIAEIIVWGAEKYG